MKTHARRDEDRIRCEICGHYLADLKSYNRHVKNHGTEKLDNTCSYCGKKSPNLNALKKHIKYVHEMTKSYPCRFCEKSFKRPRSKLIIVVNLEFLLFIYFFKIYGIMKLQCTPYKIFMRAHFAPKLCKFYNICLPNSSKGPSLKETKELPTMSFTTRIDF